MYIETESFESTFQGLFSEINLGSDKLGKSYADRNAKLCTVIQKIADGLNQFSSDIDALGDAYIYLIDPLGKTRSVPLRGLEWIGVQEL